MHIVLIRFRHMFAAGLFAALALSHVSIAQELKPPVLDSAQRMAWHTQHLTMREASSTKDLEWAHIGPMLMSGRVTDIAVPAGEPFTYYIATASGGLWKTTNEGTTWEPLFDDAPSGSTGAVACAPSQPSTLWVGLGESNIFRSSMSGTGVYKSTDEGKTWTHMGLADTHQIARIVIHPSDPNIVYVAAGGHEWTPNPERGVYKTSDGGATWELVLQEDEMTGAVDLAMDPSDPQTLYASMWHRIRKKWSDPVPGPGGGIYKTTDGGKTWSQLSEGLPPRGLAGRMGVVVAPSNPQVVYVVVDNHEVARKAEEGERDSYNRVRADVIKGAQVYRSNDGGATWSLTTESSERLQQTFATYGWVFGQMRVDPNDENTIFVLGVSLLKSTDGGKTFESADYRGLHGDHHAMWINPENSQHIVNGNDGGINLSYDGGKTWKNLENLPVVQFYNVAVDNATPFNVYGSIQDNMSWMGPSNHRPGRSPESNWKTIPGGEASYIALDPEDNNVLYSESFYGSIMRSTLNPRRTKSIVPKAADGESPLRGQWLAPFQLSPHNPRIIYHGMQYVFRSVNRGDTWERISPDLTAFDPEKQGNISFATISTLCESPLKFGLIYAGTDDGRLHVTRNGGLEWTEITRGLPEGKWFSRVVASRFDEGTVYATQNGKRDNDFQVYVWRSRDYGQSWEDISGNIPGGPVNVIVDDSRNKDLLYVGTDLGVYITKDAGQNWEVLGSKLPLTFVHDLVVHPRDFVLVAATHGRGMFTLDVGSLAEKPAPPAEEEPSSRSRRRRAQTEDDE